MVVAEFAFGGASCDDSGHDAELNAALILGPAGGAILSVWLFIEATRRSTLNTVLRYTLALVVGIVAAVFIIVIALLPLAASVGSCIG